MDRYKRIQGGIVKIDSKCHPVYKGVNTIGRNKIAVVNVKNLNVSQNQALLILVDENQHFLADMNSSNGTYIDGTKLIPFKLHEIVSDSQIKFGDVQASYLKVSSRNSINTVQNQTLEMTQNVTQNFYAANTQLMDADDSGFDHNYTNVNNRSESTTLPINDIHEMATQEVNFPSQLLIDKIPASIIEVDTVTTQMISEEEILTNIHDAPTQVITFKPDLPEKDDGGADLNIHDAPTQVMTFSNKDLSSDFNQINKNNVQKTREPNEVSNRQTNQEFSDNVSAQSVSQGSSGTIILNTLDINKIECNMGNSSLKNQEFSDNQLPQSVSQGSSETIILDTDLKKIEGNIGNSSRLSSPGPSVSQINRTFEDSSLNNSKDVNVTHRSEIEETLLEDNVDSNDSIDFLTMQAPVMTNEIDKIDNNKENVEKSYNQNVQASDSNRPLKCSSNPISGMNESDSDTDIESNKVSSKNSSQNSDIGRVKRKPLRKLPSSSEDSNIENITSKKKPLQKLSSDSDSECEIEATQDIGFSKKPVKKLDSEDETTNFTASNSDSETDCDEVLDQMKQNDVKRVSQKLEEANRSDSSKENEAHLTDQSKNCSSTASELDNKGCALDKTNNVDILDKPTEQVNVEKPLVNLKRNELPSHSESIGQDNVYKDEKTIEESTQKSDILLDCHDQSSNMEDKLNDTDCIPATQDAFAEAFSYRSEGGKSSSTEDFRLGLTQLMEDSLNDGTLKMPEQNVNDISEKNAEEINNIQKMENVGDIYTTATQRISDSKISQTDFKDGNTEKEDMYMIPTQQITEHNAEVPSTSSTTDNDIYDVATQQLSEIKKGAETEKDDDIYMLATQPINTESQFKINTESQFKIPKSYTFKKKSAAVLEESLSCLLGDSNKDDDIFDVATQKITEPVKDQESLNDTDNVDNAFEIATQVIPESCEDGSDIYLQPTQNLDTQTRNVSPCLEEVKHDKVEDTENITQQNQSNTEENKVKECGNVLDTFDLPTQAINTEPADSTNTQEELEFCIINNVPVLENVRPDNPLAHVLNENEKPEVISEVPELRRSRRRSVSPLLEPSQPKRQKKLNEATKMSKITEENPHETLSQIENFIKKTNDKVSSTLTAELSHTNAVAEKTTGDNMCNVETLSQIEAFIKKPVEKTYSKTRVSKRLTDVKRDIGEISGPSNSEEELKLTNSIQKNIAAKRTLSEQDDTNMSAKKVQTGVNVNTIVSENDKPITQLKSEGEENCSFKEKDVVKSDIDQSFALLESKSTKSRKKTTDSILPDFRVTVTSHRRSMGIAATSVGTSKESRRHTEFPSTSKRKLDGPKNMVTTESDSSDVEVPKKKPTRGRYKANNENTKTKSKTKIDSSEDNLETADRSSKETKVIRSSRRTAAKTEKNKESGDDFEERSKEVLKLNKKDVKVCSDSKLEEITTPSSDDGAASKTMETASKSRKQTKNTNSKKFNSGRSATKGSTESVDDFEEKAKVISKVSRKDAQASGSKSRVTTTQTRDDDGAAVPQQEIEAKTPVRGGRKILKRTKCDINLEQGSSSESNTSVLLTTPKKQKRVLSEELLNSAERARRKLKPKVVFTMMEDPQLESLIRQLGGSVVDSVNACTVLVTEHVKRSQKLLAAVGQGKPICSPQWIKESKKSGEFLDPWDFILVDKEAETKWNFSLKESIKKAMQQKLLSDYIFHVMATSGTDVLKGAIEACGGKCVGKISAKNSESNFVVIASPDQRNKYSKTIKQNLNIKIVEPEAIFDGVLRQELRFSKHLLT